MLSYQGWLAGHQTNLETINSQETQSNFAVGYRTEEFQPRINVNDRTGSGGSVCQKLNKKLEKSASLSWTAGNSDTHFGIPAKYQIDPETCFLVKGNGSSLMGPGYIQIVKPGIKPMSSALPDSKNINAGATSLVWDWNFQHK